MEEKEVVIYDANGEPIEDVETPTTQDVVPYNEDNLKHLEVVAGGIERFVEAQQKIQKVILRLAKPGDWVIFGETACLSGPGTERIAAALGISFGDFKSDKKEGQDKNGKYYTWETTCKAKFGGREIEAVGQCGTRNKFFGRVKGSWRQIDDIDEPNIKMASRRNAMKEGVRLLLGLRNIPIPELQSAGVKFAYGTGDAKRVEFNKPAQEAKPEVKAETPAEKPVEKDMVKAAEEIFGVAGQEPPEDVEIAATPDGIRKQIGEMLLNVAKGDTSKAQDLLEQITTFTVSGGQDKGKKVPGKRNTAELSEKQLFTVFGKAKKLYRGE